MLAGTTGLDEGDSGLCGHVKIEFRQAGMVLDDAGENHQQTLAKNGGDAIEGAANADEKGLFFFRGGEQIKAVDGNVLGGGTESQQPKKRQGVLKDMARWGWSAPPRPGRRQ